VNYVLAPLIDPSGHMLLSVRGNSYRLRSPRISDWHRGFVFPEAPTVDTLLEAGLVTRIEPVGERRAVEEEGWWHERLIEIDRQQR
jgi:hypothetical protein